VHREERRQQVVLMVDTSLSMSGENMALAAVAAAVLALKLHPGDLSVVLFEDEARVRDAAAREEAPGTRGGAPHARPPVRGATNIAAALALGQAELGRGRDPRRSAVIVTDGVFTAGPDPRPGASDHVL
jgi:uncharacterized protein with von Willebrand factor type A (vWA) domain